MRLRTTPGGLIAEDTARGRWARLPDEGDLLSFLSGGREAVARAQDALAGRPDRRSGGGGAAVPPALDPRVHALGAARDRLEPDAGEGLLPRPGGQGRARLRADHRQAVPEAQAERPLPRGADVLRRQPHVGAGRRSGDVVALAHAVPRLRARARVRAGQAARRRDARGGGRRRRRLVRPQRLERARRAGRRRAAQHLRPGDQGQDVRELDRLRRGHRRRAPRLDGDATAASGSTASCGARARPPTRSTRSARCSPTPRPASGSTPAT